MYVLLIYWKSCVDDNGSVILSVSMSRLEMDLLNIICFSTSKQATKRDMSIYVYRNK